MKVLHISDCEKTPGGSLFALRMCIAASSITIGSYIGAKHLSPEPEVGIVTGALGGLVLGAALCQLFASEGTYIPEDKYPFSYY